MTVQTGLITSLFAVLSLVLYLTLVRALPEPGFTRYLRRTVDTNCGMVPPQHSGYAFMFNMPLAKLYTNSLMSTLNSRRMWKAVTSGGSDSVGGQRSRVNVNVLREEGGRSTRVRASLNEILSPPPAPIPFNRILSPSFLVCIASRSADPCLILQITDRIVIGIESHQMTDFGDVKDNHYPPENAVSFVPDQKAMSPAGTR